MKFILIAVKTKLGYYYTCYGQEKPEKAPEQYNYFANGEYLVNGKPPEPSFVSNWYFSASKPKDLAVKQSANHINYRFELINKEMASDKIPALLLRDQACTKSEEHSWEWDWRPEFAHLRSLYNELHDIIPQNPKKLEFELNIIMEVNSILPPPQFSYPAVTTGGFGNRERTIGINDIEVCLLDKLTFPTIMQHTRPCRLSSKDVYDALRTAIRLGIDPAVATISSDYDFCLQVDKLIPLADPQIYDACVSIGSRSRRSQYVKRVRTHDKVPFFQMTHAQENYKGYTPIDPLVGENSEDLKKNLNALIEDTLTAINKPIQRCTHCGGLGYIDQTRLATNRGSK